MNTTITIRLDKDLDRELAKLAKRTGRSKSDLAREALRKQLMIQRFRHHRMMEASRRVREESMRVNAEFDAIEDAPDA